MYIANIILLVILFICLVILVWLIVQTSKTNNNTMSGWIARDEDGTLWFFMNKPYCGNRIWFCDDGAFMQINPNLFPTLHWEDEAIEVELIVKEVKNDNQKS